MDRFQDWTWDPFSNIPELKYYLLLKLQITRWQIYVALYFTESRQISEWSCTVMAFASVTSQNGTLHGKCYIRVTIAGNERGGLALSRALKMHHFFKGMFHLLQTRVLFSWNMQILFKDLEFCTHDNYFHPFECVWVNVTEDAVTFFMLLCLVICSQLLTQQFSMERLCFLS